MRIAPLVLGLLALGSPAVPAQSGPARAERDAEPAYQAALALAREPGAQIQGPRRDRLLDAIEAALEAGACPTRTLTEASFAALHGEPRFRASIRAHARQSEINMIVPGEPGATLRVSGVVRDGGGRPVAGALVYVFHTDARGLYGDETGGEGNPRLFGYLRTAGDGRYAFRTIRPGPYPDQREPVEQHIHFEIDAPGFGTQRRRMGFADDPFWTGRARPEWVAAVRPDADGAFDCSFDLTLERE